jgi:apolipoprotein D and lipocalin family protein
MKRRWIPYTLAAVGAGVAAAIAFAGEPPASTVTTVPDVDLDKYSGTWFELARFPNRFQRDCDGDVRASYKVLQPGKVGVLNQCRTPAGAIKRATGIARPASPGGPNSKLKVTFFWPFRGDYWIVDLDPGYRWAIVGDPSRKYLWFLSREPQVPDGLFGELVARAARQGFDVARLVRTRQGE